jgi:hypothetical protein
MMVVSANARDGNWLLDSLHRDIRRQRRTIQNSLALTLHQNVRKVKVLNEHFDGKERRLVSGNISRKRVLGEKHDYYTQRGLLTMDMVYSTILHMLEDYERAWVQDIRDLKVQDERMVAEVNRLEHKMKARKNDFLFFKNLYN